MHACCSGFDRCASAIELYGFAQALTRYLVAVARPNIHRTRTRARLGEGFIYQKYSMRESQTVHLFCKRLEDRYYVAKCKLSD